MNQSFITWGRNNSISLLQIWIIEKNKTCIWIFLFNSTKIYIFDTYSWSEFSEDKMDYGSVWLELLIGPCRYMSLSATFEFTTKMCLCSNHRVSPIQRIGWFVWRESFLWSDPVVSYMIWTGSVRSSRISDWHNPDYALSIALTK